MKRYLVILVLSVLLVVSVVFNIWSLVPAASKGSASDNYAAEPAPDKVFAFFVGNPPLNEAAPDSIWIIHKFLQNTEQITLIDSNDGYYTGFDDKGFQVFYGAKFNSPEYILYTVIRPPKNGFCQLDNKASSPGKYFYKSDY
jgi:hypothetical protein